MASAKPSAGNDHSRVRRTDDVSLSTLQNLLDRQASFIQTLQSELTAMKNDLSATKNTQVATVSKLNAAESRLHFLESHQSAARKLINNLLCVNRGEIFEDANPFSIAATGN